MNYYNKYILPKILNFVMKGKAFKDIRSKIVSKASGIVLEIGFGSGLNLPYYKNITKLYALDPSSELYKLAKDNILKFPFQIEYLNASAEKIPLADNCIDSVISTWNLCSIANPKIALGDIYRVLKPGGKFIFIEHGKSPKSLIFRIQKILTPISEYLAGGCNLHREIDVLIKDAGFNIKKIENFKYKSKILYPMYSGVAIVSK